VNRFRPFLFLLVLACFEPAPGLAEVTAEAEVSVLEAAADWRKEWEAVLARKGQADYAAALEAWLKAHPHGPPAVPALLEQARAEDNLTKAAALLRLARGEGQGSEWGARAAYELARLEYARERPESAQAILEEADAWPKPEDLEADWLFWKAQCRFVLKGFQRARDDFEHLAAAWPRHPRALEAQLGAADCSAALKDYARAEAVYQKLSAPGGPLAAQALWGWAGLKARQGDAEAARSLYLQLKRRYPDSFEAGAVEAKLKSLAAVPRPTPAPAGSRQPASYWIQVGAYARKATALKQAQALRRRRWPAVVVPRHLDGRTLHLVKVGPYKGRADAESRKKSLEALLKERLYIMGE
jgi:tetratricopeptide (TPR) repeat protein